MERDDLAVTAPLQVGVSVLRQYDQAKYILLDDKQKIYAVLPLASAPLDLGGIPNVVSFFVPPGLVPGGTPRSVSLTIAAKDLGASAAPDVPGVRAHHYAVDVVSVRAEAGAAPQRAHFDLYVDPRLKRPASPLASLGRNRRFCSGEPNVRSGSTAPMQPWTEARPAIVGLTVAIRVRNRANVAKGIPAPPYSLPTSRPQ